MQKKSLYLTSLMLTLAVLPNKSNANVSFSNYVPTIDKEKISGVQSAYGLVFEKTDEANANFSTYEKDSNGQWNKVYYKYETSIKSGVVSTPKIDNENGTLGNLVAHFIHNDPLLTPGSAIFNQNGEIGNITADYINNNIVTGSPATAIWNSNGKIGYLVGDFVNNVSTAPGAAITNMSGSSILGITGNFIGNKVPSAPAGAIYNQGSTIGFIKGDFIGNESLPSGGAINNDSNAVIGDITGSFIGNKSSVAPGGAISNSNSKIGNLKGDFISNASINGGAIYNTSNSTILDITGNFIGNTSTYAQGGAIYNDYSSIENIKGSFIKNQSISQNSNAFAGAVYNTGGTIKSITGEFLENFAKGSNAFGGAISNQSGMITEINSDFNRNYAEATFTYGTSQGGAISNSSTITKIRGNFKENHSTSISLSASGGAISNQGGSITTLEGNFTDNYAKSINDTASGGAISNQGGSISNLIGNFTGNYAESVSGKALGGALQTAYGTIFYTGNFIGNYAKSQHDLALGGAIQLESGFIIFSTTAAKPVILIENNKTISFSEDSNKTVKLNSFNFGYDSPVLNINTVTNTHVDIRDPMTSFDRDGSSHTNALINKTGAGSLLLWGDNKDYRGDLNINGGTFYAMFDDVQDLVNDASGQRLSFDMSNANISFLDGTVFKPKVSSTQIANIGNTANVNGAVALRPYNVSSLNAGTHSYNVDYNRFEGIETDLIKVGSQGGQTEVVIKRDLAGYNGLTSFADIYRKRQNLSQTDREMYDNIYYTGKIDNTEKEKLNTVSGEDTRAFQELHKASIRQFNRQISSRIQNKDCPSCGMLEGFSDQHLWFNVGQNWVEKESRGGLLGYDYSPTSLAFGYDYDVIPNALTLGVAISYAYGDVKGKGGSDIYSRSEVDEYLASLYWKYKPIRAYTTGSVGGGVIQNKTKLTTDSVSTRGEYDTAVLFSNIEVGYDFGNACYVLEPFVGVDYSFMQSEAYNEKGLGARHFDKNSYNTVELPIGFRISRNMVWDSFIFTPAFELAYARNVGDRNVSINSHFVGAPESSWAVSGNPDDRDSIRSKINVKVNNIYIPFAFNFGYARDTRAHYTDDQLYLTVRYNF